MNIESGQTYLQRSDAYLTVDNVQNGKVFYSFTDDQTQYICSVEKFEELFTQVVKAKKQIVVAGYSSDIQERIQIILDSGYRVIPGAVSTSSSNGVMFVICFLELE